MKIRKATRRDVPAIRDIYNDAIAKTVATFDTEPKSLSDRRKWFLAHKRHPVIVAVEGGEVLGYACLTRWSDRCAYDATAEDSVYIRESARGKGVGTALLRELMKAAKKGRFHMILARISDGNEPSVKLHERFGFTRIGTMRECGRKFGRLLDVVLMQALL